jgi:hypothetical protein
VQAVGAFAAVLGQLFGEGADDGLGKGRLALDGLQGVPAEKS